MLGTSPRPSPPKPQPERMRLRVERQTLRRLPRSGAIVFTIRVYLTPLAELGPGAAGRLAGAIRGMKEHDVVYREFVNTLSNAVYVRHRRQWNFEDAALEWLDGRHREEIKEGLVQE
ncbi:hypothetical protein B0F90DRAFT_583172 [Multifurca ochricompacta]|uniref:Uncharacterized protein n=1 Tax=Multifurca ochricompacta TaxID=376703 RepID=A0AAD4QKC2_9AGAM|nr:hypothetical protein B0F90DRAFT_583172 [Multifurca ochricompacta]